MDLSAKKHMNTPDFFIDFLKRTSPEYLDELQSGVDELLDKSDKSDPDKVREYRELKFIVGNLRTRIEDIRRQIAEVVQPGLDLIKTEKFLVKWLNYAEDGLRNMQSIVESEDGYLVDDETISQFIQAFIDRHRKSWKELPWSREEAHNLFSEEHLAKLSLRDYILLLQRFPGEMVTHVTRHGVRDHSDLEEHQTNIGRYHDGAMKILDQGRLISYLAVLIADEKRRNILWEHLMGSSKDRAEALQRLDYYEKPLVIDMPGSQSSFDDIAAIHFAAEHVLDAYYGSEHGNEVFFVFPSMLVASQYRFMNPNKVVNDFLPMSHDSEATYGDRKADKFNDLWVWTDQQKGIDINAGILFLPRNANVDPSTGSQYQLDSDMNPIESDDFSEICASIVSSSEAERIFESIFKKNRRIKSYEEIINNFLDNCGLSFEPHIRRALLIEMCRGLGMNKDWRDIWNTIKSNLGRRFDRSIKSDRLTLFHLGVLFKRAKNTVSAEEFWNDYFSKNPDIRPNKIVFYDGDPTLALKKWREDNGISTEFSKGADADHSLLTHGGFHENIIQSRYRQSALRMDYGDLYHKVRAGESPDNLDLRDDMKIIALILREMIDERFPE